jgi:hypothetical protein
MSRWKKWVVVALSRDARGLLQRQSAGLRRLVQQTIKLGRRAAAHRGQFRVPQPAHHVVVDHRHRVLQRKAGIVHIVTAADQTAFLGVEGDEHQPPCRTFGPRSVTASQLDDRHRTGGVVVRAVMDGPLVRPP